MSHLDARAQEILECQVFIRGASRPFRELTEQDASARAQELRDAVGWGPTMRVAPVAQAWRQLANTMRSCGAERAGELTEQQLLELAPRLWLVMPASNL